MKSTILKIIAMLLTIVFVILFFTVDEDIVFTSYVGLVLLLFVCVVFYITTMSILVFDDTKIGIGKKHKEKRMIFSLMVVLMFVVISFVYAIPYIGLETWFSLWSLLTLLLFVFTVMVLSFVLNYVIVGETSLTYMYVGFAKRKTVQFDEIQEIVFGGLMNTFKLKTKDSWYLIDVSLKNADEILNTIYRKTAPEMHQEAFKKLAKFYRLFFLKSNLAYLEYFKNEELTK